MAEEKVVKRENTLRVSDAAFAQVEAVSEHQEISLGEAAEHLIEVGWNRRKALSKYSSKQKKGAKKKRSKKTARSKSKRSNGAAHASA